MSLNLSNGSETDANFSCGDSFGAGLCSANLFDSLLLLKLKLIGVKGRMGLKILKMLYHGLLCIRTDIGGQSVYSVVVQQGSYCS